jgi:ABC-type spermidine/putrescine transport system permease subunit I
VDSGVGLGVLEEDDRRRKGQGDGKRPKDSDQGGVWYPKWFWPGFAAPASIWMIFLFLVPLFVVLALAFGTSDPIFRNPLPVYQPWYWSVEPFKVALGRLFGVNHSSAFWFPVFARTFVFVGIASLICLVLGYTVAYFVARYGGKRKVLYLILLISPFWISYLMRIFAWQGILQVDGYLNRILVWLHLISAPVNWLDGKPITVILGLVYGYIPYMILPLYGQLDRIEQSMLEAGRDLGASPSRTFFRVTLPLSRQAILAGMIIVSLPMFGDYYTNNLLGSTHTAMYGNLIDGAVGQQGQGPLAGSLVLILMVMLILPMLYYMRSTRRAQEEA